MADTFDNWLHVFAAVTSGEAELDDTACPHCEHRELRYQYVAVPETRTGYAAMWCENCWHGIWLSRVKVPDGLPFATFAEAEERDVIPEFTLIQPDG